jgi:lipopolysaccharide biosynthesis glycosyltransferase
MDQIRLFVGMDRREPVAFHVFTHSVLTRTKAQVSITPVSGEQRDGSNSFIYQRFLVPWMCGYNGWAIFADGDMLCLGDIQELWNLRQPGFDVMVVKHEYGTRHPVKYLGQRNEDYLRKNWSSLMLINCGNYPWRKVTPEYVSKASGKHLHRFEFLKDERIGDLPAEWNFIVGELEPIPDVKIAHFSIGLPCWSPYKDWPYAREWLKEREQMNYFQPWTPDESVMVSER